MPSIRSSRASKVRQMRTRKYSARYLALFVFIMSQAMFMSHRTQRQPLVFSAAQTASFLNEKIDVYQQTKIDASSSGRVVTVDYDQLAPMTRGAFYRMYVVWYASQVLSSSIGFSMAPSNAAVTTAAAAIRSSIDSAQQFEDAYLDYVFTPDTTDLGYYAKDNEMPAIIKVGCQQQHSASSLALTHNSCSTGHSHHQSQGVVRPHSHQHHRQRHPAYHWW